MYRVHLEYFVYLMTQNTHRLISIEFGKTPGESHRRHRTASLRRIYIFNTFIYIEYRRKNKYIEFLCTDLLRIESDLSDYSFIYYNA
jgi:hypothetical protein